MEHRLRTQISRQRFPELNLLSVNTSRFKKTRHRCFCFCTGSSSTFCNCMRKGQSTKQHVLFPHCIIPWQTSFMLRGVTQLNPFYPLKRLIRVCFILLCQQYYVKSSVSSFSRSIYSHYIILGCLAEPQIGYFCFSVKHTHNLLKLSRIILSIVL